MNTRSERDERRRSLFDLLRLPNNLKVWFRLLVPPLFLIVFLVNTLASEPTNSPSAAALAELIKPTKKTPFKQVIFATTQHRIIDFDTNNAAHVTLRGKILRAAAIAGRRAHTNGLTAARANEAGNHIEPFVRTALHEAGLQARIPITTSGERRASGYPDIEIVGDVPCYLELKTYNAATANTTQRSFYFSPSAHPKVTRDALHLLLGFELEKSERKNTSVFVPVRWQLMTLENLQVDLKFEFNQSNRGLYGPDNANARLGEGAFE